MAKWLAFGTATAAVGLSIIPISNAAAAPKPAKPTISHFVVTPKVVGPGGGVLHYSAFLTDTKTYSLYITPKVAGLPKTFPAHAHVAGVIHLPANHGAHPRDYSLTFSTWDGVYKRVELSVLSTLPALPSITDFVATPRVFSPSGGVLSYSADLSNNTKTYEIFTTPKIPGLPKVLTAHARVAGEVTIPANHTAHTEEYSFTFDTWGGVYERVELSVQATPPPPTTTTTTVAPVTTTTTAVPVTTPPTVPPVTTPPTTGPTPP